MLTGIFIAVRRVSFIKIVISEAKNGVAFGIMVQFVTSIILFVII